MKRDGLVRDGAAAVLRHVAPAALGAITLAVNSRHVGAAPFGFWNLLGAAAFLLGLADAGLSTAILRASAGDASPGEVRAASRWAARRTALVASLLAIGVGVLMAVVSRRLDAVDRGVARLAIPVALAAGVALAAFGPARARLHGAGAIAALSGGRIVGAAAQCAVSVVATRSLGVLGIALGYAAGVVVEIAAVLLAARDLPSPAPGPLSAEVRAAYGRVGRAALVANVAVVLCLRLDVFLLGLRFDLGTVAAYATTSRLVDQLFTAVKQLGFALVPRLGARSADRARVTRVGAAVVGGLAAAGLGALAFEGPAAVRLLAGDALDARVVGAAAPWLAFAAIVAAVGEVPNSALWLGGAPSRVAKLMSASALVNAAVTCVAVICGSVSLAAAATLIGNSVLVVPVVVLATRELGWTREDVARAIAPAIAALSGSVVVGLALGAWGAPSWARLALCPAVGGFAALAFAVGSLRVTPPLPTTPRP